MRSWKIEVFASDLPPEAFKSVLPSGAVGALRQNMRISEVTALVMVAVGGSFVLTEQQSQEEEDEKKKVVEGILVRTNSLSQADRSRIVSCHTLKSMTGGLQRHEGCSWCSWRRRRRVAHGGMEN